MSDSLDYMIHESNETVTVSVIEKEKSELSTMIKDCFGKLDSEFNGNKDSLFKELKESLNKMGYSCIYEDLTKYLNNKKVINIDSLFNNIKHPFCYYYNIKNAENILQNKSLNKDGVIKYLKRDSERSKVPYQREEIEKKINEYENVANKKKDQLIMKEKQLLKKSLNEIKKDLLKKIGALLNNKDITPDNFKENLEKILAKDYSSLYNNLDILFKLNEPKTLDEYGKIIKSFFSNDSDFILVILKDNCINLIKSGAISSSDNNTDNSMDRLNEETYEDIIEVQGELPEEVDSTKVLEGMSNQIALGTELTIEAISNNSPILKALNEIFYGIKNKNNIKGIENYVRIIFAKYHIDLNDKNKATIKRYFAEYIKKLNPNLNQGVTALDKGMAITVAIACGITDINNDADLNEFINTVQSDDGEEENVSGKYAEQYKQFLGEYKMYMEKCRNEIAMESLVTRYEVANAVAESRSFYESEILQIFKSSDDKQNQSGVEIASNISGVDIKLNQVIHYTCKPNRTEHEESALKYTAFDITFKNTFNLTNPIIEKLGAQQVDLRSDLFKYRMYNQDTNTFNQSARDKYVAEKLEPIGLTPEEIEELGNAMTRLPAEVENNYYILSGKFVTVQDNFEKIAKIYALGEIIDNIKNLFKNGKIFSDNAKLGDIMGFEFDESEPADIVGDCLMLKGKVNGTETKIKYDLRTGKLYMNAMTQQEFNPPKITIGNDEPNTEIGDLGNFGDLLEGYQPTLFTQADKVDYSKPSNENGNSNENEVNDSENKDSNQKTLERLMENKLLEKLTIIGNTVREKAGEQSKENNVIDEFLRTFNILPDEGNSDTIEFLGGSNLYILLESIKNTNDEDYLLKFSKLMSELMSFCGLTRGKNNLSPKEPDFDSVTIFNIDEKNATQDIISLQRANQSFFSDGERDRIKGCECHFDSSVNLSFANIIVQKCCRRYGEGWKISTNHAQEFVDSVKKGIEDIKHDESDVVAMENMIEDESMWS